MLAISAPSISVLPRHLERGSWRQGTIYAAMGGRGAFYFSGGNPSPAEKIDVFGFSSGMAVSPSKERYALSGSLIGEGGGTSPARGMMRIRSPIPILLTGRVGGPFGAPIAASVGKAACRRIADIIDVLFHPTISRAASRTASGSLSCPRGFTPTIGFPEATAASISDCIHPLWAQYMPERITTQWALEILSSSS